VPSDPVARKIHDIITTAMNSLPAQVPEIEYLSDSTTYANLETEAKKDGLRAARFFHAIGFPIPSKTIVMFAQTGTGLKNMAMTRGCRQRTLGSNDPISDSYAQAAQAFPETCADGSVVVLGGATQTWGRLGTLNFHHVLPHELFHQWQMTNTKDCGPWICGNTDFPRWLWEGTAQVMTRMVWASWNTSRSVQEWHDYWYTVERRDMRSMCIGVSIETMANVVEPWPGPSWCAYSKGQLAVEYLLANYGGLETLRKLHTEKTTPGLSTFPDFFRSITGKALSDFYAEVNAYFKVRGWD
jgi:hypothetical protein